MAPGLLLSGVARTVPKHVAGGSNHVDSMLESNQAASERGTFAGDTGNGNFGLPGVVITMVSCSVPGFQAGGKKCQSQ